MMIQDYIPEIVTALIAFFGGGLLERKRKKVEIKTAQSDAIVSMQKAYNHFVEDSKQRYDELKERVSSLKQELERVERYWQNKYQGLKQEFENYKQKHG